MKKRIIRPHKGGRTERININMTPGTKGLIVMMAERESISIPDLIEQMAEDYHIRQTNLKEKTIGEYHETSIIHHRRQSD